MAPVFFNARKAKWLTTNSDFVVLRNFSLKSILLNNHGRREGQQTDSAFILFHESKLLTAKSL